MKKLFAIALCLMLLLSGCTFAADGANTTLQLRDLALITGPDSITDLSGLSLTVESAGTEDIAGFRLTLEDDNGPLSAVLAVTEEYLYLSLTDADGTQTAYALDMANVVQSLDLPLPETAPADGDAMTDEDWEAALAEMQAAWEQQLADMGLTEEDLENMTDEELDEFLTKLYGSDEDSSSPAGEDPEQAAALEQAEQIIARCTQESQEDLDGVTYDVSTVTMGPDDVYALLDTLPIAVGGDEHIVLSDALDELGVTISLDAVAAVSQDGEHLLVSLVPVITNTEGDSYSLNFLLDGTGDDGFTTLILALTDSDEQPLVGMRVSFAAPETEDADWLPEDLTEGATVIDHLESEQDLGPLTDDLADFFGQLSGKVFGVAMGNSLISALDDAFD